jgi:RNA polymerase sigma factor (TIGR02999 family)
MTDEVDSDGTITRLLLEWSAGDESALTALVPLVYEQLRVMAARQLRTERGSHTLQRTALVHEAYFRLVDQQRVALQTRAQFFSLASQMMRRILVDHARRDRSQKRGGGVRRVSLDDVQPRHDADPSPDLEAFLLTQTEQVDLSAIDDALKRLEAMDPRQGKLVELRFFGGLNIEDTAQVLGVSSATVKREWISARAWLLHELTAGARE